MSKQIEKFNARMSKKILDEQAIMLAEQERSRERANRYAQIDPENLMREGNIKEAALVASLEGMQALGQVLVNSMINEIRPVIKNIVGGMFLEYIEGNRLAMLQYAETVSKQQVREQLAMNLNIDDLGGLMTTGNPIVDDMVSMVNAPIQVGSTKKETTIKVTKKTKGGNNRKPKTNTSGWTPMEDDIVRDIVLGAISSGGTQIEAFNIASEHEELKKQGRTPSAVGFRWNGTLRKRYKEEISQAKRQRNGQTDMEKNQGVLI